jgi:hypothetical protein
MCLTLSPLYGLQKWNWDGDRIIHQCIVPSGRAAVGYSGKKYEYPIDVREFLITERNEVLRRVLREELVAFAVRNGVKAEALESRVPGSFDLRASVVNGFVSHQVAYRPVSRVDYWQFPDETLFLKAGDCEDRALLIAALLIASGVSSYNVRVAIGKIRIQPVRGQERRHDHAWVVYKNEAGRWQILEPLIARHYETRRKMKVRVVGLPTDVQKAEYVPYYLFNDVHLWEVDHRERRPTIGDLAALRSRWSRLDPEFAGQTHRNILTQALAVPACPEWFRQSVTSHFTTLFGQVIDEQDNFLTHGYDSRDHFDNAFIDEGWALVRDRLWCFKQDNVNNIPAFSSAAHAIADFYAHSSYVHFADTGGRTVPPYNPDKPSADLANALDYEGGDFDLTADQFSTSPDWRAGKEAAAAAWKGKIISGRYAQHGDSQDMLERLTPTPRILDRPGDRAALPHHNEIAVDGDKSTNTLYQPVGEYHRQLEMRRNAAAQHIRSAFLENWTG